MNSKIRRLSIKILFRNTVNKMIAPYLFVKIENESIERIVEFGLEVYGCWRIVVAAELAIVECSLPNGTSN